MPGTLEHAVDVMLADGVDLRAVFGPEHGFRGIAPAGASTHPSLSSTAPSKIATTTTTSSPDDPSAPAFFDPRSGLPVFDVYRKSGADLVSVFRRADVDVIAFDMQDVGARFYTYLWTLYDVLVAAAASDPPMRVVVLDRPNPVGGDVVEGPAVVEDGCASFLARKSVALRHGMTLGELARMLNRRDVPTDPDNPSGEPARLAVVPCRGWRRETGGDEIRGRPVADIPTPDTALAYLTRVCSKPRTGARDEAPRTRSNSSARRGPDAAFADAARRGTRANRRRCATARADQSRARRRCAPRAGAAKCRRISPRRPGRTGGSRRGSGGPRRRDRALFREGVSLLVDARRTYPNEFAGARRARAGARLRADRSAGRTTRAMSRAAVFNAHQGGGGGGEGGGAGAARAQATRRRMIRRARASGPASDRGGQARRGGGRAGVDAAPPTIRPRRSWICDGDAEASGVDAPPEETATAWRRCSRREAQLRTFVRVREAYLLY